MFTPSCIAANVAIAATMVMGMIDHVMGATMKSRKPVALLAMV